VDRDALLRAFLALLVVLATIVGTFLINGLFEEQRTQNKLISELRIQVGKIQQWIDDHRQ